MLMYQLLAIHIRSLRAVKRPTKRIEYKNKDYKNVKNKRSFQKNITTSVSYYVSPTIIVSASLMLVQIKHRYI